MTQVDVFFVLGISWLAFYAKSQVLYAFTVIILVIWGYHLSTGLWIYSATILTLAAWMAIKAAWPRLW